MEKQTTTKYVLYANAVLLVLGTIVQGINSPMKSFELSCLFVTWLVVCVWYVYQTSKTEIIE